MLLLELPRSSQPNFARPDLSFGGPIAAFVGASPNLWVRGKTESAAFTSANYVSNAFGIGQIAQSTNAVSQSMALALPFSIVAVFTATGTLSLSYYATIFKNCGYNLSNRGGVELGIGGALPGTSDIGLVYGVVRNNTYPANQLLFYVNSPITSGNTYIVGMFCDSSGGVLNVVGVGTGSIATMGSPGGNATDPLSIGKVDGSVSAFVHQLGIFNRRIDKTGEFEELKKNAWRWLEPRRIWIPASAASGINAALTLTDETDALSSTGSSTVAAAFTATDATDALSSAGSVSVSGAFTATDATDTLSGAASVSVNAALTATDSDDALTSAGSVLVTAQASLSDEDDSITFDGTVGGADVLASVDLTDEADALQAESTAESIVISLGGQIHYPQAPEKVNAKFWRLDDDDTLQASFATIDPLPAIGSHAALYDDDDAISFRTIVVQPLRIIRANPRAGLRR